MSGPEPQHDQASPSPRGPEPSTILVRRMRAGDGEALGELFARLLPGLRAFVRLNMGPLLRAREQESDLMQSSFRRILEDLPELDFASERELRVYVYRRALNHILTSRSYHTADRRDPRVEAGTIGVELPPEAVVDAWRSMSSPSAQAIRREEVQRLERAFDELPPLQREIVALRRMFALSIPEIAQRLGIEMPRCRYQLGQAMAKLSFLLGE